MSDLGSKETMLASEAPPERATLVGTVLDDRYEVLRQLGEGGMGTVYEARHRFLKTHVAIKLLKQADDEESLERLKREAQSASAIGNQHIVDVRDFGRTPDGTVYVAMELIDGEELYRVLQREPLGWKRAVHVAKQVAEALGAAHAAGVVHRDLKAENVLLCERDGDPDFVKVVDFGIAMIEGSARITMAGRVMGTPQYMSPEQCAGVKVDHRTDIYALGILMYEMVTSKVPFNDPDITKLVRMQLKDTPAAPSSVNPFAELPARFDAIVLRCLEKRAKDRYPTMAALVEALEAIESPEASVSGSAPAQAAPGEGEKTADPVAARATTSGGPAQARSKAPVLMAGAALGVLGLGLGFGAVWIEETGRMRREEELAQVREEELAQVREEELAQVRALSAPDGPASTEAATEAATEPTTVQPPESGALQTITLSSVPPGAEVYEDGALLGTTPIRVLRPEGDARLRLEVRGEGRMPHPVVLSRMTADALSVTLEEAPRAPSAAPLSAEGLSPEEVTPRPREAAPSRPRARPTPRPTKHREFRNPWQ